MEPKSELEDRRLGLPPNQPLVSASEVAPTTNAADEVALAVTRAKGGVLQMARVTSEVVMLPLLPVAGRRNGVSAASARTAGSGEAKRRQSIEELTAAARARTQSTICEVSEIPASV